MPGSAWDVTKPADTDLVRNYPTLARQDKSTLKLQLEVEHYVLDAAGAGAAITGRHKIANGNTAGRPPSSPIVAGALYANNDLNVMELQDSLGGWVDAATVVFVGSILIWPMPGVPATGYLECNGQAVSRTTFARLFAAIGTSYGVGDGSTTFNVPNLAGRVVVGFQSGDPDFGTMAQVGGAKTHTLVTGEIPAHSHGLTDPTHAHGLTDPGHTHGRNFALGGADTGSGSIITDGQRVAVDRTVANNSAATGATVNAASTGITSGSAGGGGAHNNIQPYMVMKYIIKY